MKIPLSLLAAGVAALAHSASAQFEVTVSHTLEVARPAEVVVIPFSEVRSRLPGALMERVVVRRADTGEVIPSQVTNFNPDDRRALYDDLVFQHDFAAGEREARFIVELADGPVPPFATKTFARHVPERLDDFAWENDRLAHRIYGPGLDTPAAGRSRMISSGIDVWTKRVRYPIVDRWYLKGHDAYHQDTGEGMDFYSVGTARGCGGTGVWDGSKLHVSHNWAATRVLANGPIRSVFEIDYAPWDAGEGVRVAETKRFTVDAGRNLHHVESRYTVEPADRAITVALGLSKHPTTQTEVLSGSQARWLSLWEAYPKPEEGSLGTAVMLAKAGPARVAEDEANHLLLAPARSGEPLAYYLGAGWDRSGDFADQAAWENYLKDFALRLDNPVRVTLRP
jgi:hypothetical protein